MHALPILFINLNGEMIYILEQRLRAQNITPAKIQKGSLEGCSYSKVLCWKPTFLPREAMLSAVYAVVVCLCVSVRHTPVLYQNGYT